MHISNQPNHAQVGRRYLSGHIYVGYKKRLVANVRDANEVVPRLHVDEMEDTVLIGGQPTYDGRIGPREGHGSKTGRVIVRGIHEFADDVASISAGGQGGSGTLGLRNRQDQQKKETTQDAG